MTWKMLMAATFGLAVALTLGCSGTPAPSPKGGGDDNGGDHADHGPGPHGGVIIELGGGKFHGEFKPDHKEKSATVWLLGVDAKTPAPMKTDKVRLVVSNASPKIEIDLLPTDKDAEGKASTFTGKHDGFAVEMEYKGTVRFNVGDKQYSGDFEEKADKK
jgi:hypothetical protein